MSDILASRLVLSLKVPVAAEDDLESFDPSDLGATPVGALVFVAASNAWWLFDPESVATEATGSVRVPNKISSSAAYVSDPATAPGRFVISAATTGGAVAGQSIIEGFRAADALAADVDEIIVGYCKTAKTLVQALVIPEAAVSGDNTNNASLALIGRVGAGSPVTLASLTLNVASGGLAQWTAKALTNGGSLAIAAGTTLTIAKTKTGTGAALPRMLVHVSVK